MFIRKLVLFLSVNFIFIDITLAEDFSAYRAIFSPLPSVVESQDNPVTKEKIELGKKLYNDTQFSLEENISCNSCHDLNNYGVDGEATSPGDKQQRGNRNSPTVYNAAIHLAQFWDGRAANVEEQALGPVLNPVEMAMPNAEEVIKKIREDSQYPKLFASAFPEEKDPITFNNFGKAIGAFERTLLTPSRFDLFLKGDDNALTEDERKGLKVFVNTGCIACHSGVGVGGNLYQKLGLVKPYETKDLGRFEATKNDADKFFFKVPSLRNIDKTGPYFHDGSIKTLEEAISIMAEHQLGKKLSKEEVQDIKVFLQSLTGELKK